MSSEMSFHRWMISEGRNLSVARKNVCASEEKTFARSVTQERERTQQILTPAQQLEMRKRVASSADIKSALAVIDGYIFGDESDGEVDSIDSNVKLRDPYTLDYAVTNWG